MSNIKIFVASATLAVLASGQAIAAENTIVVTDVGNAKAGRVVSLDMQSAGDTAAFQFALELPKGVKGVNTSKCLAQAPKGVVGVCDAQENIISAVIYTDGNTPIPAGMISLGTISFQGGQAKSGGIQVLGAMGSSPTGNSSMIKAEVATENAGGSQQK